jgi:hypothetical protein
MASRYSQRVAPFVKNELEQAQQARTEQRTNDEFRHLERAHVLGQESTYWHVVVHIAMLSWGARNADLREVLGQMFRVVGAATKTVVGLVPHGNTGGASVSPFKPMRIAPDLAVLIQNAKSKA